MMGRCYEKNWVQPRPFQVNDVLGTGFFCFSCARRVQRSSRIWELVSTYVIMYGASVGMIGIDRVIRSDDEQAFFKNYEIPKYSSRPYYGLPSDSHVRISYLDYGT
jgi:hypothetical protein